jgi:hypothetical protein
VCAHTLYGVVYFYYNWIFISIIIWHLLFTIACK